MSEPATSTQSTTLIHGESDNYIRILDGVIVLSILNVFLSGLALVDVVGIDASGSALVQMIGGLFVGLLGAVGLVGLAVRLDLIPVPSRRLRGLGLVSIPVVGTVAIPVIVFEVQLGVLLGTLLLVTAVGISSAGISSRGGIIDTAPDTTGGIVAGLGIGVIGLLAGAIIGGSIWGPQSTAWIVAAISLGIVLAVMTVTQREDIGSTVPPAIVIGGVGTLLATSTINPGWQWTPQQLSGGFTAGIVIPLLVFFTATLSLWAAGKCRAGFGPQGREYGAVLL
ncbi:MAG: phosphate ABC transporter, permease protein PstA, partial [Halobacteriaceae archaeon]